MTNQIVWKDRKHYLCFPFSFTKYFISNNRLYITKGLFTTESDELLLYRVIDISLKRNIIQKICGTGTITLSCKSDTDKIIELINIKNSEQTKYLISQMVEELRTSKKITGKEFYNNLNFDEEIN